MASTKPPGFLKWFEDRLDTGNQNWKQYTVALFVFNALLFTLQLYSHGDSAVDAAQ